MSQKKVLKFSLKRDGIVNASYGENVDLSVDLSPVKDVILGVAGALGAKKCLMLGGAIATAATATYVLVKSFAQKWPWAKVTDVDQDTIEVAVPKDKEDRFAKLLEQNKIQEKLADDFENMEDNLKVILPDEYKDHGADIIKLLKGIRLASIAPNAGKTTAMRLLEGKVDEKRINEYNFMAVGKNEEGTIAMERVTKDANVKREVHGGANMMLVGLTEKDNKTGMEAFQNLAGENILVKIVGSDLKETFERKFKPTTTVKEVRRELNDEAKKYLRIFRDGKKLNENMTLAQAAQTGSTVNWEAKE